jgi:hypothetical protein
MAPDAILWCDFVVDNICWLGYKTTSGEKNERYAHTERLFLLLL